MDLHILDVSNYIHQGSYGKYYINRGVRETNGEYEPNDAPIGGVKFLIDKLAQLIGNPNNVVIPVFDRTPTIKRKMYFDAYGDEYGYKGTRTKKSNTIGIQREYAEKILLDMGFPVKAVDGYEADDVIYSIVQYYGDDFDKIYIHTRDSDLSFLVSPKVHIAKVGDQGKDIDIYNYSTVVERGENVLYNTCHLRKLCKGDTSDNIPGVGWRWAELLDTIISKEDYPKLGDLSLCRKYIRDVVAKFPAEPGGHNVLRTFNIVVPLLVPFEELDDFDGDMTDIDLYKFKYYSTGWDSRLDKWNLEDWLEEYIDSYYE